jgi:hypothetical protein
MAANHVKYAGAKPRTPDRTAQMKRNLLTLLMDLPPADIRAAAEFWGVRLAKRTHADNVALLYQAITDRWHLEDALDELPPLAREVAGMLALEHEEGVPREALMLRLGVDPLDLSDALDLLRRAAIAFRQGTGVWYLPRELATLIARAIRERQRDIAGSPTVPQLLASLDLDVLQEAARRWRVPDANGPLAPGDRERLLHGLRQRIGQPRARAEAEATLSPGARRVVAALREDTEPLPLGDAVTLVAAGGAEVDRRALLRELTASLLACHGWRHGERVLVMPAEFREPAMVQEPLPPLVAVSAESLHGWRHPHALAWDVLTLLRLAESRSVRWPGGGLAALAEDHAFAAHVAPRFWLGIAAETPPTVAVAFLAALARGRGLLAEHEADGRRIVAVRDPVAWAKQRFGEQTRALFATWRGMAAWPEGHGTAITLWGVDWPAFRGGLLDALAACQPGHWYRADALLDRLARVRPPLLGEDFTAASAVMSSDRGAVARTCAEVTLRTALTWFGAVEWGRASDGAAMRITDSGWWLLGRGPEPAAPPFGEAPLAIQPDCTVLVLHAEPAHLWPLLALADVETLDRVSVYRITAGTLRRTLRRGLSFAQVVRFLEQRTGGPLPDAVRATLDDWARAVRRVVLERAVLLSADDPEIRDEAMEIAKAHGATVIPLPDGRVLLRLPEHADELEARLKAADLTPIWKP